MLGEQKTAITLAELGATVKGLQTVANNWPGETPEWASLVEAMRLVEYEAREQHGVFLRGKEA